ncbi:hypothetical protein V5O48_018866 [Marasmius crinis-equi]|uniref:Uncharacterized protein n=1 Tax=Marasmius crinis-equi TaxID=585013 RepID=A0ABR3EK45_9AGAR
MPGLVLNPHSALIVTPQTAGAGPDPVGVILSPALYSEYPFLPEKLSDAIIDDGDTFSMTAVDYPSDCLFKTISWDGYEGRAGVLWLDDIEFRAHINRGTLDRILLAYQKSQGLSVYSDTYMIIYDRGFVPDSDQPLLRRAQAAVREKLHIEVYRVDNMEDAARAILNISIKLFETMSVFSS